MTDSTWQMTYAPGDWIALAGPRATLLLPPAPGRASVLMREAWEALVRAADLDEVAAVLAQFRFEQLPAFCALFATDDGLRALVRGPLRVLDADDQAVVAEGSDARTWTEVDLADHPRVLVNLQPVADDALQLPLVIGAVRASRLLLDSTHQAALTFPTSDAPAALLAPHVADAPADAAGTADVPAAAAGEDVPGEDSDVPGDESDVPAASADLPSAPVDATADPSGVVADAADDADSPAEPVGLETEPVELEIDPVEEAEAVDLEIEPVDVPTDAVDLSAGSDRDETLGGELEADDLVAAEPLLDEPRRDDVPPHDDAEPAPVPVDTLVMDAIPTGLVEGEEEDEGTGSGTLVAPPAWARTDHSLPEDQAAAVPLPPWARPRPDAAPALPGQGATDQQPFGNPVAPPPAGGAPASARDPFGNPLRAPFPPATPAGVVTPVPGGALPGAPGVPAPVPGTPAQGTPVPTLPAPVGVPVGHAPVAQPAMPQGSGAAVTELPHWDDAAAPAADTGPGHDHASTTVAPGPTIAALVCPQGHANPLQARICGRCGQPVDPASERLVAPPTIASVVAPDGQRLDIAKPVLVGRAPASQPGDGDTSLLRVASPNQDISRTHLRLEFADWGIAATDLRSTNGTVLVAPDGSRRSLTPGEQTPVPPGTAIDLGDGVVLTLQAPLS